MKCYFHFPTSKTAGIFLRRQQGSSIRERCVAGVPGRLEVFSPFFFFLGGAFSFTPNTHRSSYCTRIEQNTVTMGSSKLLLIQIIIFYGRPLRGDFWCNTLALQSQESWTNAQKLHPCPVCWEEIMAKVWRAGERSLEQEKGFLKSTFLQGTRGQDCIIQQCHLVHHAPQIHHLTDQIY